MPKTPDLQEEPKFKHCDDYIRDYHAPKCLRFFLLVKRQPAVDMALFHEMGVDPKLFANHEGKRVRVVMASRLGDVGITDRLDSEQYQDRVPIENLTNFSDQP